MSNIAIQTRIADAVAALSIVGHKTLSVAPVAPVLSGEALTLTRANKAGDKFVVRDVAGLMLSGNPSERAQAFAYMMAKAVCNGEWGTLAKNVVRVFGSVAADGMGWAKLDPATGRTMAGASTTNRQAWETILQGLADKHLQKPFKGEKLTALVALQCARATFAVMTLQAEADKAAALSAGTVAGVIDGETSVLPDAPALSAPVVADEKTAILSADTLADESGFAALMQAAGMADEADETAAGAAETETSGADSLTA